MAIEQELRNLIAEIENSDPYLRELTLPQMVARYNQILGEAQQSYRDNSEIFNTIPMKYNMFDGEEDKVARDLKNDCKTLLQNLNLKKTVQQPNIVVNIGSLHGNFSFDNIITTIQNSNIGNQTQIISYVNAFREELSKATPDKSKLRNILQKLEGLGEDVIVGLLVEAGKRFLGW